jgi:hypothetical protein
LHGLLAAAAIVIVHVDVLVHVLVDVLDRDARPWRPLIPAFSPQAGRR